MVMHQGWRSWKVVGGWRLKRLSKDGLIRKHGGDPSCLIDILYTHIVIIREFYLKSIYSGQISTVVEINKSQQPWQYSSLSLLPCLKSQPQITWYGGELISQIGDHTTAVFAWRERYFVFRNQQCCHISKLCKRERFSNAVISSWRIGKSDFSKENPVE